MELRDLQSLSINLLHSKAQADLLDRLDELRDLGFRRRISPPQLVICGDQNSGKTTIFEAITGISLPVNDGMCTRFATEVTFKKSAHCSAHVRIRPSPNASPNHRSKLGAFSRPHNWLRDIAKLFSEARLIMGLVHDGSYSQDTLQLEVSGPMLPDLTVVDLPGLLSNPGPNQTSDDVATVQRITEFYMNNPRNIVLAVVSAEHLLSQQTILHMISSCATRTMGIMTKPDLFEPGSVGEDSFYARLKNQDTPLKLGWHMLRNLDANERKLTGLTRDDMESMFISSTPPWKDVSPTVVGIDALRNRLSKIILGQVELQITTLAAEIQKDLETSKTSLDRLGPSRNSNSERRLFLTRIGERFASLTKAATLGEYDDAYFRYHPSHSARRLRSVIKAWAETFAADMEERGHSYDIIDDFPNGNTLSPREPLSPEDPRPVTKTEYINGLAELLKQSKGRELPGLANTRIIGELFVRYSLKWASMAKAHVFEAWKKVKKFVDDLLHHVAGSSVGEAVLREILNQDLEEKLQMLYQKVDELVLPYRKVIPSTLNRRLNSRIRQLRRGSRDVQGNSESIDFTLCSELLDCMLAYYSVALGVFVDNVANLAVENCLVSGLEDLISPSRISQMSDEQINKLTTDSEDVQISRNQLSKRIKVLELAAAACAKCEMNALESSSQNYSTTVAPAERLDTKHSSVAPTILSDTSTSPPMSPGTPDTDLSPPVSRVTSRSSKGTSKQQPILRAFPLPTRAPPPNSPLPLPPRPSTAAEQPQHQNQNNHSDNNNNPTSPPPIEVPPAPRVPSRTQSLASSNSDRSAKTTKSSKSTKRGSSRARSVWDDRPTAWAAMSVGMFRPVCEC